MGEPKWQLIDSETEAGVTTATRRMHVPGGWLYNVTLIHQQSVGTVISTSSVFVPDPIHHLSDIVPHDIRPHGAEAALPIAGRASA